MEKVLEKFTIDDVEVGDRFRSCNNVDHLVVKKTKGYIYLMGFGWKDDRIFDRYKLIKRGDKTETQTEQQTTSIKSVLSGIDKLLEYKDRKYGNASSKDRVIVFGNKCSFGPVLDNKLNRVASGEELLKNDLVDIAGYLILTLREKGWDDFSEFMD